MKFINTPDPVYISTKEEALKWSDYYSNSETGIGFDTETTGLSIVNDRIKFFSLADDDTRICAPVRLLPYFKKLLENEQIPKYLTNAKYDMHMAENHEIYVSGTIIDTISLDFLLDENREKKQHSLKQTAKDYLGLRMAPFKTVFGVQKTGDKQAQIIGKIHDAIERNDRGYACQILAELGQMDDYSPDLAESVKRVLGSIDRTQDSNPKKKGLAVRSLLAIGRKAGVCDKSTGSLGYVVDIANYMGFDLGSAKQMSREEREEYEWVMDSEPLREDFEEQLLADLTDLLPKDHDPLGVLTLTIKDYASLDAWASLKVGQYLQEKLADYEIRENEMYSLLDMYYDVYEPLLKCAYSMERRGFKINMHRVTQVNDKVKQEMVDLEQDIAAEMGQVVNLNSSAKLRPYFYKKEKGEWVDLDGDKVEHWSSGGTGGIKSPSTGEDALLLFAAKGHKVADLLLQRRKLKKIEEFLTKFGKEVDSENRIHTSLNPVGTKTGRWSSRDPNLQNIPAAGELGSMVRDLFVASEGKTLIVADYGQLEMRIMAHFAKEPAMIKAISEGKDLHSMTASLAAGYDYDHVVSAKMKKDKGLMLTKEEKKLCEVRSHMKAVGFGLNYGIGAAKLGMDLGLPLKSKTYRGKTFKVCPEGSALIKQYFNTYPRVKQFIENTKRYTYDHMFVQTVMGRFRRLSDVRSSVRGIRAKAERQGPNSVIQGSAADIMNTAMLKIDSNERLKELEVTMLLQVHDEVILECPDIPSVIEEAKEIVQDCMENAWKLSVPLEAEPGFGYTWEKAK